MKKDTELTDFEKKVEIDLQRKKGQVLEILQKHPMARNSDLYLQWLWLKKYGRFSVKLPFIPHRELMMLGGGCLESVRRVRQKIQNEEHLYPPTDIKVKHKREQRSKAMRRVINRLKKERSEQDEEDENDDTED